MNDIRTSVLSGVNPHGTPDDGLSDGDPAPSGRFYMGAVCALPLLRRHPALSTFDMLAGHARREGRVAAVKQETLAAELGCSVRTIQRDLEYLTELGLIRSVRPDPRGTLWYALLDPCGQCFKGSEEKAGPRPDRSESEPRELALATVGTRSDMTTRVVSDVTTGVVSKQNGFTDLRTPLPPADDDSPPTPSGQGVDGWKNQQTPEEEPDPMRAWARRQVPAVDRNGQPIRYPERYARRVAANPGALADYQQAIEARRFRPPADDLEPIDLDPAAAIAPPPSPEEIQRKAEARRAVEEAIAVAADPGLPPPSPRLEGETIGDWLRRISAEGPSEEES